MLEVNVLGYGQMGRQIASLFSLLGCNVAVWSHTAPNESYIHKQLKLASKLLDIPIKENSIRVVSSINALNKYAITIEAITEDITVKQRIFQQCKCNSPSGYYTNTSSYSPTEIDDEVGGLHFLNPIVLRLVEYCRPINPRNDSIEDLLGLLRSRQFKVVNVHPNRGYLVNSLLFREIANVFFMIEHYKYSPGVIESVYESLNRNWNVFGIVDLVGVDTTYAILENLKAQDNSVYLPDNLRKAIQKNVFGKKNKTSIKTFLLEIYGEPPVSG